MKPPRFRLRLATALSLVFGVLLLLAIGAVAFVSLGSGQRTVQEMSMRLANIAFTAMENALRQHLEPAEDLAEALGRELVAGRLSPRAPAALQDFIKIGSSAAPQIIGGAFFDPNLRVVGYGMAFDDTLLVNENWQDRPEYQEFIALAHSRLGQSWFTLTWVEELGRPAVVATLSLEREGRFLGVVTVLVGLESLSARLTQLPAFLSTSYFALYGPDQVLAHAALAGGLRGLSADQPLPGVQDINDPRLAQLWLSPPGFSDDTMTAIGVSARVITSAQTESLALYREIPFFIERPLVLGMMFSLEDADQVFDLLQQAAFVALAVLALALVLAWLLGRAVARPARYLARSAQAIRSFHLEDVPPVPRSRLKELDRAAQAVNKLLEALAWFLQYVPKGLVLDLMRQGQAGGALEERDLAILFTDVAGFTSLAETMSPREVTSLLNQHLALIADAIAAEGGTVDKYLGDGVMAFWGAPQTVPDPAARAVAAAIKMARAVADDNKTRRAQGLTPIRLRIGLHFGRAMVGNIGTTDRLNYTAIGDNVNIAQRLEALGKDHLGEADVIILVSSSVVEHLDGALDATALGAEVLNGRHAQLSIYRLEWEA